MAEGPLLAVEALTTLLGGERGLLRTPRPPVRAVDGVSFAVHRGEILGVVGESGCGKSTLGRTVLGIQRETSGSIRVDGHLVSGRPPRAARRARRDIQYVHQDAGAALDPWWSAGKSIEEALIVSGVKDAAERTARVDRVLNAVGLDLGVKRRYPHELSGGQLRRVTLARVLVLVPRLVILDEPTSGLDLSVQATVLRLLRDLLRELGLTYVFISHDLSVVRQMCDRVAIMYLGRIVELADTRRIFAAPAHPYTRALLSARPTMDPRRRTKEAPIQGDPPNPIDPPSGCRFRTRCPFAEDVCAKAEPLLADTGAQEVACHMRIRGSGHTKAP